MYVRGDMGEMPPEPKNTAGGLPPSIGNCRLSTQAGIFQETGLWAPEFCKLESCKSHQQVYQRFTGAPRPQKQSRVTTKHSFSPLVQHVLRPYSCLCQLLILFWFLIQSQLYSIWHPKPCIKITSPLLKWMADEDKGGFQRAFRVTCRKPQRVVSNKGDH